MGVPAVLVDDPVLALGRLAGAVRSQLAGLTAIGITGSSGKTGTKDLLAHLLSGHGATVAPPNSFNNEIGVPLTVLRCDAGTDYLVAELGARRVGNIAYLCGIVAPQIAVVLNVGSAHAGVFGSREATAATKGELVEALPPDGIAVLNADDPLVAAMAARTRARVVRTGLGQQADVRAVDVRLDGAARPSFTLVSALVATVGDTSAAGTSGAEQSAPVTLLLHGEHHVANALAAAAVALSVGVGIDEVAARLGTAGATSSGRMHVVERPDGVLVVDDSYNANPDSMAAALRALVRIEAPSGVSRRRWAVLGEMLELGADSHEQHRLIGVLAREIGVHHVVAVGAGAGAYGAATWVEGVDEALAVLDGALRPGDVVLVKASRAVGLDALARALLDSHPPTGQDDPDGAERPNGSATTRQNDSNDANGSTVEQGVGAP
jgi:UDP-N-acetylmuramoyl-tripeptide--D-alanyl-D-alanine ligase